MPSTPTIPLLVPTVDVGDTPDVAPLLRIGEGTYGSIALGGDHDLFAVYLEAGQAFDIRVLGVGLNPLGDGFISIYDSTGALMAQDDDGLGGFGLNPSMTYSAAGAGYFYIDVSGYDASVSGDFLLTVAPNNIEGTLLTVPEIAWELTNNFNTWFTGGSGREKPAQVHDLSGGVLTYDVSKLTEAGAALAVQALKMWTDVLGVELAAASGGDAAQIDFDDSDPGATGYCSNTLAADGTTITLSQVMVTTDWLARFGTGMDSYSFETYVHELGHALGLGHAGNYNGWAVFGTDNFYLNDSQHLSIMSYMQSLNDEFSYASYNDYINASFRYVLTPMIADIYAIGTLYGLSTTTRTGDTTYGYNSNTGNVALDAAVFLNDAAHQNYVAFTIFDNGGIDTVDMSGFAGAQRIDLHEGASSDVLGGRFNMGIAYGTAVENAIGGSGNDILTGNGLDNDLKGGAGDDSLQGAEGNDTLWGGAGADTLAGSIGDDLFHQDQADGWDDLYGGLGNDTAMFTASGDLTINLSSRLYTDAASFGLDDHAIWGIENLTLEAGGAIRVTGTDQANVVTVISEGAGAWIYAKGGDDALTGGDFGDTLLGGTGNDTLTGAGGADRLDGGAGDDTYFADSADKVIEAAIGGGFDTVWALGSFVLKPGVAVEYLAAWLASAVTSLDLLGNGLAQTIIGNDGANLLRAGGGGDTLLGGGGNDSLWGGSGTDSLVGGAGHDNYRVDDASDVVVEAVNGGFDQVVALTSYSLAAGSEVERLIAGSPGQALGLTLTGNGFAQQITGDSGANLLIGGGGDDLLEGGKGNDTLIGGAGAVTMTGGKGADTFQTDLLPGDVADQVTDFNAAGDTIILVTGPGTAHALDASAFLANATGLAETTDNRVIYDTTTGDLWYDADGSDAGLAVLFLHLQGAPTGLTAGDFMLV